MHNEAIVVESGRVREIAERSMRVGLRIQVQRFERD